MQSIFDLIVGNSNNASVWIFIMFDALLSSLFFIMFDALLL